MIIYLVEAPSCGCPFDLDEPGQARLPAGEAGETCQYKSIENIPVGAIHELPLPLNMKIFP